MSQWTELTWMRVKCKTFHKASSTSTMNFHKEQESSWPENGRSGSCKFTPVWNLERIVAHIFADVSSHKCERQHGGQRGIMQYTANLEQIKHLEIMRSMSHDELCAYMTKQKKYWIGRKLGRDQTGRRTNRGLLTLFKGLRVCGYNYNWI